MTADDGDDAYRRPASAADDAVKRFLDGTHRLVSPAETIARVRPLLQVMGITRVATLTGLDDIGIPVVMAYRPNARSLAVSSGKGLSLEAAQASAIMEAIESYHAERVARPLRLASLNELRFTNPLLEIGALPQLAVSDFHENKTILWIEGVELVEGRPAWVPYEMVHSDYTLPLPTGSGCFPMTSNGLASGNHPLEAISHGICEVVERDATTLWQLRGAPDRAARRLDPGTVDDAACRETLERYERADIAAGVWETTTDVAIPVFHCVIIDRRPNAFRRLYANVGVGCHPDRRVALLRALTEAAQGRLIYISGARDDRSREAYEHARDPDHLRRVRERIDDVRGPLRSFQAAPTHEGETFAADVRWEIERLSEVGVRQVVVVDLSRAEFGVSVVRVILPGLESIGEVPGYVPGPRARAQRRAASQLPR